MRFKIHDTVYVKKDGKSKEVCEIELIDSQEIYYMSDNTSYHVDEIDSKKPINTKELIRIKDLSMRLLKIMLVKWHLNLINFFYINLI